MKTLHPPDPKPMGESPWWSCTSTTCKPGHHRAGGKVSIFLQPPLMTPFPFLHSPLESPIYWEVGKKNGWFGSNLAGDQAAVNGDFLPPSSLCSQLHQGGVFSALGPGAASGTSGSFRRAVKLKEPVQCHWFPEIPASEAFPKADGGSCRRRVMLHPFTQEHLPKLV